MDDLFTSTISLEEVETDNILRPKTMDGYIGQEKIKDNLSIYMQAAMNRGEQMDHVLLYGPPGLGKTTLAHIIANTLKTKITVTSGPAISSSLDLAAILTNLTENEVLFIDEIHRLNHNVEEILYPAMEDFTLDFVVGKGPSAKTVRVPIKKFTLVGATTKAGNLTSPLRDRFGVQLRLLMYSPLELQQIVCNSSRLLNTEIEPSASLEIASRSRGTPRIANRLLKRVRDFAEVKGDGRITLDVANFALKTMEIDELGLDSVDKNILTTIIDKFGGGPVGLDTIASATGEDSTTVEDVYEPYLLQLGFIARTPRGRICMPDAYAHIGRKLSEAKLTQLNLFDYRMNNNENK
ncbi:MAG: Holliday junction branch migration DNA helicase RuvB [Clostridia bacterium]